MKHTFGRDAKRLRPLQKYTNHSTVQSPTVDLEYLKSNISDVPHKMAIEQILMQSPKSTSSSQISQDGADEENLNPEIIITKEVKVKQNVHRSFKKHLNGFWQRAQLKLVKKI